MTTTNILDVIARTLSVMEEQRDDNGECIAEANHALYIELKEARGQLELLTALVTRIASFTKHSSPEDREILDELGAEARFLTGTPEPPAPGTSCPECGTAWNVDDSDARHPEQFCSEGCEFSHGQAQASRG